MRAFVIGALCAGLASGFAPRPARQTPASLAATASEVESYQKLMSDYLVKSHEQRIKAVAEARTQATLDADARIHQLERELSSLLGGSAPSAPSAGGAQPVAEAYSARSANTEMLNGRWGPQELARTEEFLAAAPAPAPMAHAASAAAHAAPELTATDAVEIESLRTFVSNYLVRAAQEKYRAVAAAKAESHAEIQSLKAQLAAAGIEPAPVASAPAAAAEAADSTSSPGVHPMYAMRKTSSSRWGAQELQRIDSGEGASASSAAPPPAKAATASSGLRDELAKSLSWGTRALVESS